MFNALTLHTNMIAMLPAIFFFSVGSMKSCVVAPPPSHLLSTKSQSTTETELHKSSRSATRTRPTRERAPQIRCQSYLET